MRSLFIFIIILSLNLSCATENKPSYKIDVSAVPLEGGEIEITPDETVQEEGTDITLTPRPSEGYLFIHWEGDYNSTEIPLSFTLTEDVSVTAVFEKKTYPLNVTKHGEGIVIEEVIRQKTDYEHGTIVELTAEAASGWSFMGWIGDLEGIENPTQVTVESELNIIANFSPQGVRMFGGSSRDVGSEVIETTDGGYLIVGSTESSDGDFQGLHGGKSDIYAIKLNAKGKKQWVKTYGGTSRGSASSVTQASDGGYVLAGSSDAENELHGHNFISKIDANGNELWNNSYGGFPGGWNAKIIQTLDEGYITVGGISRSTLRAILIIKIDKNGSGQWIKYLETSELPGGSDIIQTSDGNYILTGFVSGGSYVELIVIKLDPLGNIIWIKDFGGSGTDYGRSITETSDGNYLITGYSKSNDEDFEGLNNGNEDLVLLKVDTEGNLLWVKTYGGAAGESGNSIIKSASGDFVITGFSGYDKDIGLSDILVYRIDSNGNQIWANTFGASSFEQGIDYGQSEQGNSVIQTSDGGFLITGTTTAKDGNFYDYYDNENIFLIKLDANGNITPFNE